MKHKYCIQIVWSEDDKAFLASVPELPGCIADGATVEKAIKALQATVDDWIETAKELGREIPEPLDAAKMEERARQFQEDLKQEIQRQVQTAVGQIFHNLTQAPRGFISSGGRITAGFAFPEFEPAESWKQQR